MNSLQFVSAMLRLEGKGAGDAASAISTRRPTGSQRWRACTGISILKTTSRRCRP